MSDSREMTLQEVMNKLPSCHSAYKEYQRLVKSDITLRRVIEHLEHVCKHLEQFSTPE